MEPEGCDDCQLRVNRIELVESARLPRQLNRRCRAKGGFLWRADALSGFNDSIR